MEQALENIGSVVEMLGKEIEKVAAERDELKKAATNLLKWHDEELPKWTGFISMNLIRKGMTTLEGAKDCEAEVRALRKALNETEKEIDK